MNFRVLEKSWKSPGNLILKKGTNPGFTCTVPLKCKLPPSRETRLVSLETSLVSLEKFLVSCGCTASTVPPETIYPFTEVLPRPIRRSTPRSRLGNDAACRNFTEVLPRFAAT